MNNSEDRDGLNIGDTPHRVPITNSRTPTNAQISNGHSNILNKFGK